MNRQKQRLNDTYSFPYEYHQVMLGSTDDSIQTTGGGVITSTATLIPEDAVLSDGVIKKIIGTTVSQVEGVLMLRGSVMENITGAFSDNEITRGITYQADGPVAEVEVKVIAEYGKSIPDIIRNIQQNVHSALLNMAGMQTRRIQVDITDVMTREEYDEKYNKNKSE